MESLRDQLTSLKGTYALALRLEQPQHIQVGALGWHGFPAGNYIYVGSAYGSGGIRVRLARHIEGSHALHWHIDYLREVALPVGYWLMAEQRLECVWSVYLDAHPSAHIVLPGFGASDCKCTTHLYRLDEPIFNEIALPEIPHFHSL